LERAYADSPARGLRAGLLLRKGTMGVMQSKGVVAALAAAGFVAFTLATSFAAVMMAVARLMRVSEARTARHQARGGRVTAGMRRRARRLASSAGLRWKMGRRRSQAAKSRDMKVSMTLAYGNC
jgi:hypothetical protein